MIADVDGLVAADTTILLFFEMHKWRLAAPPSTVAVNTTVSKSHAAKRCQELEEYGLLRVADDRGYYQITDLGVEFINGTATKEEITKD